MKKNNKIIMVWVKGGLYKKYIYFIMGWLDGENVCIIGKYDYFEAVCGCVCVCGLFLVCKNVVCLFCLVFYVCVFLCLCFVFGSLSVGSVWV